MQTSFDEDLIKTEYIGNQENGPKAAPEAERTASKKEVRRCPWCFVPMESAEEECRYCGYHIGAVQGTNYYLKPGTVLNDRFVIGMVVGAGGFGITYKAWDRQLDCERAVKEYFNTVLVHRNMGTEEVLPNSEEKKTQIRQELDRFLTEARYTSQFRNDPNFVEVYDFFEENGTAYMVMDFLHGKTLEDLIEEQGRIQPEEAERIFSELASALFKLHEMGIVHRDVSPDNVFVLNDGRVKLVDLGAADFPEGAGSYKAVILKPGLAPPEQYIDDTAADKRTDIYALSATMYWALTGIKPVESTNRLGDDPLKRPSAVVPGIPHRLDNLILRGMSVHPEIRFKNMQEFKKVLLGNRKVSDSIGEIRKRKKVRLVLVILFTALIVTGTFLLFRWVTGMKSNALLNGREIEVWIPYRDNPETALTVAQRMSEEFLDDYPGVSIVLKAVPVSEYPQKVQRALSSKDGIPALFSYQAAGSPEGGVLSDMTALISETDKDAYRHSANYTDTGKIPLGFRVICIYESTVAKENGTTGDLQEFLDGNYRYYVGDSADFSTIQEKMPGCYKVHAVKDEYRAECLTDLWCVNESADADTQNAAVRLLSYWLGEVGQDILCVQNREAMPLNKKELQVYLEVNAELKDTVGNKEAELFSEGAFEERIKELCSREDLDECID